MLPCMDTKVRSDTWCRFIVTERSHGFFGCQPLSRNLHKAFQQTLFLHHCNGSLLDPLCNLGMWLHLFSQCHAPGEFYGVYFQWDQRKKICVRHKCYVCPRHLKKISWFCRLIQPPHVRKTRGIQSAKQGDVHLISYKESRAAAL